MSYRKFALFSVANKTEEFFDLVRAAHESGHELLSSGGTCTKIKEVLGFPVADVSEHTGYPPVLGHRVVTLAPQIHGGLLADLGTQMSELNQLRWPFIDLLVCTFYPLEKTIKDNPDDFSKITESIDIGGPALIRSACKGNRIPVAREEDFGHVAAVLRSDTLDKFERLRLQATAIDHVAHYIALEAKFRKGIVEGFSGT